jgi:hypothetical protein
MSWPCVYQSPAVAADGLAVAEALRLVVTVARTRNRGPTRASSAPHFFGGIKSKLRNKPGGGCSEEDGIV